MSRAERAERRSLRVTTTPSVAMKRRRMTISSAMKESGEESGSDSSFGEEPVPPNGGPGVSMRSSCTSKVTFKPVLTSTPSKKKADEDSSSSDSSSDEVEEDKPVVQKTAANELSKVLNILESTLKCPVCLNLPRDLPVPCCPSGHIVCRSCRPQVADNKCPTCRQQMPANMTNSVVGSLIEQVEHKCKFSDQGCEVKLRLKEIKIHEKSCLKRTVKCAFKNCGINVMLNKFKSHVSACHSRIHSRVNRGMDVALESGLVLGFGPAENFFPILQYYSPTECYVFSVWVFGGGRTINDLAEDALKFRGKLIFKGKNQNELTFNNIHISSVEDVPSIDRCMEENGKHFLCLPVNFVNNIGIDINSDDPDIELELIDV